MALSVISSAVYDLEMISSVIIDAAFWIFLVSGCWSSSSAGI